MLDLSHKKLDIWNYSLDLVSKIYSLTSKFPKEELFGLTSQLRRASVSVSSNVAEGLSRTSKLEKIRFLEISRSSLVEIDTQLEITLKLKLSNNNELIEIEKLLNSLFAMITSLKKKIK
ncbi:MAG: four helix bundle protein [Ignavibacteriaceae bacterium]|nr:four helix bundle protein [Ignavibacteriaceae bacterium]